MRNGWQIKTLGDIAQVSAGNSAPQDQSLFKDGIYPFFRTADAGRVRFGDIYESTDYLNEHGVAGLRRYPKGTILFPKSGASTFLNHRVMLGVDGCVSSHLATIVADKNQIEPRFLLYFLSTIEAQDLVQDHAYPSLNLPTISAISIQAPSLPEQRRIVGILDEAFAGIATAQANTEKNLQNARALFESHLQSVFTQRGDGWVEKRLGELYSFKNGINFDKTQKIDRGILTIDVLNMYGGDLQVRLDNLYRINKAVSGEYIVKDGDILVVRSSVKREGVAWATIFKSTNEPVTFCGFIIRGRPVGTIQPEYAVYFLRCQTTRDDLIRKATQSTITNINQFNLGELVVPLPSAPEQKRIVYKLDSLRKQTQHLASIYERKLAALAALKKSLLHEAFTGQL